MIAAFLLTVGMGGASAPVSDVCSAIERSTEVGLTIIEARYVAPAEQSASSVETAEPKAAPHCHVRAVATPVPGSRIGMEILLPITDWNGRFKMYGNGGYSSAIPRAQLHTGVAAGYAVAATDTGHQGDDPDFAVGLPEAITDWGHRAVHLTARHAKQIIRSFYGRPAAYSYFEGCSTGGHQALMSAQRYPNDFNGIIAGAPGINRTRLNIGFLWQFTSNRSPDSDAPILQRSKLALLHRASLAQCGSVEEQAQGYLENPFLCKPDLSQLKCMTGNGEGDCLTALEIGAAEKMYRGAQSPRSGEQIYPPWLPGSEAGWWAYWSDQRNPKAPMRANFFRFWAFNDPNWNWREFDFDASVRSAVRAISAKIDATDPDLGPFMNNGGRLILYHGMADPVVSPWDARHYYDAAEAMVPDKIANFARLFLAPGMGHCAGANSPDAELMQFALVNWVERGIAPEVLQTQDKARALCPYPTIGGDCSR